MTVKDIAKNVINSLPPDATMDDIIHALYVHAKFQHGEAEIKQKKGFLRKPQRKDYASGENNLDAFCVKRY